MEKIAISSFPYFDSKKPLMLVVWFTFMRPHIFQAFPHCKDLDNLVKFIIDACRNVFYANDNVVICLVVEKSLHWLTWW
jgi:Holliday junction resolvase RusA-like endonuclease